MVKHNNVICNEHFRKDWQRYVKTFFDQPMRKKKRNLRRKEKAARLAPRPADLLRPEVNCPSIRYNSKVRLGRGFSPEELRACNLSPKTARNIGISVDKRRKNKSEESFDRNVKRLKAYMAKLVVLTKKTKEQHRKDPASALNTDNTARTQAGVRAIKKKLQVVTLSSIPITGAYATLRYARHQNQMVGPRYKKLKEEAEKKK